MKFFLVNKSNNPRQLYTYLLLNELFFINICRIYFSFGFTKISVKKNIKPYKTKGTLFLQIFANEKPNLLEGIQISPIL